MLRFMAWLCLKDNSLSGSQMCIVTGPRIDLAIALIDRMKRLFAGKSLVAFNTKETVVELNEAENRKIQEIQQKYSQDIEGMRKEMESKFQQILTKIDTAKLS
jgi:hypothetical protein